MRTLIKNVTVLTMDKNNTVYRNGCVLTEGEQIAAVGELSADGRGIVLNGQGEAGRDTPLEYLDQYLDLAAGNSGLQVIDGRGGILIPGLINTHCHVSMMPFRTLGDDCADRLRRFLFPLENDAMTRRLVRLAARYGICEMLLAGVTSFVDMYYFEDEVAEACEELGIRGWLGETVIGQKTCDSPEPYGGLAYGESFIKQWKESRLVKPLIAPHATYSNSPEMLTKAYELACRFDTLYTLHASEMDFEMEQFRKEGTTPAAFLEKLGVLSDRTLLAHCVYMTEEDMDRLARTGAAVSHCIGSNTKGGRGVAPVPAMQKRGIPVGLGTDGASSGNTLDLFTLFKLFADFQKTAYHDRSLFPAEDIVRIGTMGGAEAIRAGGQIGSIEAGKKADLAIVETESVNMFPCYNPYSALVYSANASNVDTVMVNGELLVREKRLVKADLLKIRKDLEQEMGPFMEAAGKYEDMI